MISEITDLTIIKKRESGRRDSLRELQLKSAMADILLNLPDDELYEKILGNLLDISGSKYGIFAYLEEDGSVVCPSILPAAWADSRNLHRDCRYPRELWGEFTWGRAVLEKRSIVCNNLAKHSVSDIPVSRVIAVPLINRSSVIGFFEVAEKDSDYSKRDKDVLERAADFMAPALYARLQKGREERRRIKAERDLRERTAELERVNSELEAFTYSVSHDLRGPLSMLGQFAGMMVKRYGSRLEAEIAQGLQTIRNTADQMGRLIDDLLALSRVNREQMSMKPIDMREIINEVWQELAGVAKAPVRFKVLDLPPAFGDPNLIRRVIHHLLSNAVKFSSVREHPSIEVGGHSEGGCSFFHVSDNGAGFRKKDSNKLFGVFKRLHGNEFEGTGVGLAIVQRIISRHGGKTFAEGRLNRGATFHFSLPSER